MIDVNKTWRFLVNSKSAKSKHVVQRAILRAINKNTNPDKAAQIALKELNKAFTPVKRLSCLQNGQKPNGALLRAIHAAQDDLITAYSGMVLDVPLQAMDRQTQSAYIGTLNKLRCNPDLIEEYFGRNYVYTFVRQDISPEYQLVQAAHATYQAGYFLRNGQTINGNYGLQPDKVYFTVVGVKDGSELADVRGKLSKLGISFQAFFEPDINSYTAVTTYPIPVRNRGELLKYKLLRF